ncbi:hypothetical protein GY45DRAFT_222321 [Cubamyces sp. BRFM 1775]|nr:hypothetical protein GY45DRAFT_222321 [Cubamyces sp. BRFM 1775]
MEATVVVAVGNRALEGMEVLGAAVVVVRRGREGGDSVDGHVTAGLSGRVMGTADRGMWRRKHLVEAPLGVDVLQSAGELEVVHPAVVEVEKMGEGEGNHYPVVAVVAGETVVRGLRVVMEVRRLKVVVEGAGVRLGEAEVVVGLPQAVGEEEVLWKAAGAEEAHKLGEEVAGEVLTVVVVLIPLVKTAAAQTRVIAAMSVVVARLHSVVKKKRYLASA